MGCLYEAPNAEKGTDHGGLGGVTHGIVKGKGDKREWTTVNLCLVSMSVWLSPVHGHQSLFHQVIFKYLCLWVCLFVGMGLDTRETRLAIGETNSLTSYWRYLFLMCICN